jgi:hypothetical protein
VAFTGRGRKESSLGIFTLTCRCACAFADERTSKLIQSGDQVAGKQVEDRPDGSEDVEGNAETPEEPPPEAIDDRCQPRSNRKHEADWTEQRQPGKQTADRRYGDGEVPARQRSRAPCLTVGHTVTLGP